MQTKREIANGQSFASKRVSLSTFWTRKAKFEVFRQTCSGTIRGQFGDNNIKTKRKRNANFFVKLARGQSEDKFENKMQTLETKRKRNAKLRMTKVLHPNA